MYDYTTAVCSACLCAYCPLLPRRQRSSQHLRLGASPFPLLASSLHIRGIAPGHHRLARPVFRRGLRATYEYLQVPSNGVSKKRIKKKKMEKKHEKRRKKKTRTNRHGRNGTPPPVRPFFLPRATQVDGEGERGQGREI